MGERLNILTEQRAKAALAKTERIPVKALCLKIRARGAHNLSPNSGEHLKSKFGTAEPNRR